MGASLAPKSTSPALMRATPAPRPTLSYLTLAPRSFSNSLDQYVISGATNDEPAPVISPEAWSSLAIPAGVGLVSSPVPQSAVGSPWMAPCFVEVASVWALVLLPSLPHPPARKAARSTTTVIDGRFMSASFPPGAVLSASHLPLLVAIAQAPDERDPG